MAAKTANVMARVEPSVKEQAEEIMEMLGINTVPASAGSGYIQSFVPKNSMEFLIILVEKFGLK